MKTLLCLLVTFLLITIPLQAEEQVLSTPTQECIDCHATVHPGLYHSWLTSRHATTTPAAARQKTELERRISAGSLPESLSNVVVGCYGHRVSISCYEKKLINCSTIADLVCRSEPRLRSFLAPDHFQMIARLSKNPYWKITLFRLAHFWY